MKESPKTLSILNKNKGQTALIMIMVLTTALVFYSIELNWGRVADTKASTWMAVTSAASQMGSIFASYGERQMQENLLQNQAWADDIQYNGGNLKHCEPTYLFVKIIVVIIVIVITILTWGTTSFLAVLAIAWMIASIIIDYTVTRPEQFDMWNKLQQNMQVIDQFREMGISSTIQQVATDSVNIPDRFDIDGNGKWGFSSLGTANDSIGRFSFFYTERLKLINPPDNAAYEAFRQALNNLITKPYSSTSDAPSGLGFSPFCGATFCSGTGTTCNGTCSMGASGACSCGGKGFCSGIKNNSAPQCDAQCTGISARPLGGVQTNVGIGWGYGAGVSPSIQYVPSECKNSCSGSTCPPLNGAPYYLLYDDSLELPPAISDFEDQQNSFRFRLGHDDEIGKDSGVCGPTSACAAILDNSSCLSTTGCSWTANGSLEPAYKAENATGVVFPMLQQMATLGNGRAFGTLVPTAGLKEANLDSLMIDTSASSSDVMKNYKANSNDCAEYESSSNGFFWKRGADQYCSGSVDHAAYQNELVSLKKMKIQIDTLNPPKHWPYSQCEYMYNTDGTTKACTDSKSDPNLWPQDRLDDFVYQLSRFIKFNNYLQSLSSASLLSGLNQWYSQASQYIAPQCTVDACTNAVAACQSGCPSPDINDACKTACNSSCKGVDYNTSTNPVDILAKNLMVTTVDASGNKIYTYAANAATCNPQYQGRMIQWINDLTNWANLLSNPKYPSDPTAKPGWLEQSYGNPATDLCTGTLADITQCLSNNAVYDSQLDACQKVFPSTWTTTTNGVATVHYPNMPAECENIIHIGKNFSNAFFTALPLNVVDTSKTSTACGTDAECTSVKDSVVTTNACINGFCTQVYPTDATTYPLIQQWVQENTILKDAVNQRYNFLNGLLSKAKAAIALFQEGANDFGNFLAKDGPADALMTARLSQTLSIKRLPGFAIYGWKDLKTRMANNTKQTGMWHLARMEILQPKNLPEIHTSQEWGLAPENAWMGGDIYSCYEYRYGHDDVWARATRWDEETTGGLASFANGQTIWRFNFGNQRAGYQPISWTGETPQQILDVKTVLNEVQLSGDGPRNAIQKYCIADGTGATPTVLMPFGKGIGISQDTKTALLTDNKPYDPALKVDPTDPTNPASEAQLYQGAFMLDIDPRMTVPNPQGYVGGCSSLSPTSYSDASIKDCLATDYFTSCCQNVARNSYMVNYWSTVCQSTNQARCAQNAKNAEIAQTQKESLQCFSVVDYLLSSGVKSASGANFMVPSTQPYHERIKFYSASDADARFKKASPYDNTITDTDTY